MSTRYIIFSNTQFYHIYNRTTADENIFVRKRDVARSLALIDYYRRETSMSYSQYTHTAERDNEKIKKGLFLVEIHAFALMPTHFHFLVRQLKDNGIVRFVSQFQNGMAKYINIKRGRNGSLFCHPFKAKHIETEKEFLHVSRYIHLNPVTSYLVSGDDLSSYPLTSYVEYCHRNKYPFVTTDLILGIKKFYSYKAFTLNQVEYQKKLHLIQSLLIDYQGSKLFNPKG